jgi:hypothetical protein
MFPKLHKPNNEGLASVFSPITGYKSIRGYNITLTTKESFRNEFGIIQEFLVIFIFHEKELIRNYLGISIPI